MPPIYLTDQLAKIRIGERRLLVEKEGEELLSVPVDHVDQVVIFGNIGITTPAVQMLLDRQIDVVFLTIEGGFKGRLTSGLSPHVLIRQAQYRCMDDSAFTTALAVQFVRNKIRHQKLILMRQKARKPELQPSIDQLDGFLFSLEKPETLESLRGTEGMASNKYFYGYRMLFDQAWQFDDRNRRPPKDPINAMLSLGYTFLANLAESALHTVGLDPFGGFLHKHVYNRPSLALDLMEEFRPVVDGIVLRCVHNNIITVDDFEEGDATLPVVMTLAAKKAFIRTYEERIAQRYLHPYSGQQLTVAQCVIEQARQLVTCFRQENTQYRGMEFR